MPVDDKSRAFAEMHMPAFARRRYRQASFLGLVIFFGLMALVQFSPWFQWVMAWTPGYSSLGAALISGATIMGLWILPGVVWALFVIRWERQLLRRARESDYKLCPFCGYSLTGHRGEVQCPECGKPCDMEHVQREWKLFRPRLSGLFRRH